jgi:hypothetical protein
MMKVITIGTAALAALLMVQSVNADTLVADDFGDGDYTAGTAWNVAGSSGGTWAVDGSNQLTLTNPVRLSTYDYQPVPHYIETGFAETSLTDFSLTAYVGLDDNHGGAGHGGNMFGFAVLDAAGTSGYHVDFSSDSAVGGWVGMNLRRVDNGVWSETSDLDGRLAAIANGFERTYNADGSIATQATPSPGYLPNDNRFNVIFSRSGDDLTFTINGANWAAHTQTLTVHDPHAGGALTEVGSLRAYGGDPGYGYLFDDISLTGTPVPEPMTMALLGLGGLLSLRRRK